ncbi:MAG: hypothetical protein ACKVJU_10300 [Verrucomicrobiales bacterium]
MVYATNTGDGPLYFSETPFFEFGDLEGFAINGFAKSYLPQSSGVKTGTIKILTNDESASPFEIIVTGTAIAGNTGSGYFDEDLSSLSIDNDEFGIVDSAASSYEVTHNGIYRGLLFRKQAGDETAGLATFKLSTDRKTGNGLLSGSISIGRLKLGLRGTVGANGIFIGDVTGRNAANWTPTLRLAGTSTDGEQITGELVNNLTGEVYTFAATPNRYHKTRNPAPDAGRYTAVIPTTDEHFELTPGGHGHGFFSVSTSGTSKTSVHTPSRKRITFSSHRSEDQQMQLYSSELSGTITFRDTPGISDVDGKLDWTVAASTRASSYAGGYRRLVDFLGARYTAPLRDQRALPELDAAGGNAQLTIITSNFTHALDINWRTRNRVSYQATSTERLAVKVNSKTGSVSGYWWNRPNGDPKRVFSGAVFKKQLGVYGAVIDGEQIGRVEILATPLSD